MRFRLFCLVLLLVMAGSGAPVQAAPDYEKARQFIMTGVARTIELMKIQNLPRPEIAKRLRAELRRGFDVPTIAGFVLGPLRRLTPNDQKRRYLPEF